MNIGNRIKELRIKNKVTQEELAKALQISTQAVSKWENGGSPDLELVPSIATYFNVTTDYLFDTKENNIFDIEKKLAKYIQSFELKNRMNVLYDLVFKMSIATHNFDCTKYFSSTTTTLLSSRITRHLFSLASPSIRP